MNKCAIHPLTKDRIPLIIIGDEKDTESPEAFLGIPEAHEDDKIMAKLCKILHLPKALTDKGENDHFKSPEEAMEKFRNLNIGGYWTSARLSDWLVSR